MDATSENERISMIYLKYHGAALSDDGNPENLLLDKLTLTIFVFTII